MSLSADCQALNAAFSTTAFTVSGACCKTSPRSVYAGLAGCGNVAGVPRVIAVKAHGKGLSGSFPNLSGLTALQSLDIGNNALSGPVPNWFSSLSRLQVLDVSGNADLSGPISLPDSVTSCSARNTRVCGSTGVDSVTCSLSQCPEVLKRLWDKADDESNKLGLNKRVLYKRDGESSSSTVPPPTATGVPPTASAPPTSTGSAPPPTATGPPPVNTYGPPPSATSTGSAPPPTATGVPPTASAPPPVNTYGPPPSATSTGPAPPPTLTGSAPPPTVTGPPPFNTYGPPPAGSMSWHSSHPPASIGQPTLTGIPPTASAPPPFNTYGPPGPPPTVSSRTATETFVPPVGYPAPSHVHSMSYHPMSRPWTASAPAPTATLTNTVPDCGVLYNLFPGRLTGSPTCCQNPRVNCTTFGYNVRVTKLNMSGQNLTGQIHVNIVKLDALRELYLADNQLLGPLPMEIRNLTQLRILDLNNNRLSQNGTGNFAKRSLHRRVDPDEVPDFSTLVNLITFKLGGNALPDFVLTVVARIPNLKELDVSNNNITTIPAELGALRLEAFALGGNGLTGALPAALINMTSLRSLDLTGNKITTIPAGAAALTSLQNLKLGGNNITGAIPAALFNMTALVSLDLSGNVITSIPDGIASLTGLKSLNLASNSITGSLPVALASLTLLENIKLSDNSFSGVIPPALAALTNLKTFEIANNTITGGLEVLASATALQQVDISGNSNLSTTSIPGFQPCANDPTRLCAIVNSTSSTTRPATTSPTVSPTPSPTPPQYQSPTPSPTPNPVVTPTTAATTTAKATGQASAGYRPTAGGSGGKIPFLSFVLAVLLPLFLF